MTKGKKSEDVKLKYLFKQFEHDQEMKQILDIIGGYEFPDWNVPPEFYWPTGKKDQSTRGAILLRCGMKYMREKYEPDVNVSDVAATNKKRPQISSNPLDSL